MRSCFFLYSRIISLVGFLVTRYLLPHIPEDKATLGSDLSAGMYRWHGRYGLEVPPLSFYMLHAIGYKAINPGLWGRARRTMYLFRPASCRTFTLPFTRSAPDEDRSPPATLNYITDSLKNDLIMDQPGHRAGNKVGNNYARLSYCWATVRLRLAS